MSPTALIYLEDQAGEEIGGSPPAGDLGPTSKMFPTEVDGAGASPQDAPLTPRNCSALGRLEPPEGDEDGPDEEAICQ
ncbi:hypothetical protein Nepgr_032581 [Nepenthes gracilis]|uniref:Uncharacterized protein n=1 Tax=Nepenthes gracilis TaxID=150966 RepID=A0AAD3TIW8_NEPGR|nr:hypothetical protein Nepgr_032581 [Nepenthes gracilis]